MSWMCVFQSFGISVKTHIPQQTHVADIYSFSADVTLATNAKWSWETTASCLGILYMKRGHKHVCSLTYDHICTSKFFPLVTFLIKLEVSMFLDFEIICLDKIHIIHIHIILHWVIFPKSFYQGFDRIRYYLSV